MHLSSCCIWALHLWFTSTVVQTVPKTKKRKCYPGQFLVNNTCLDSHSTLNPLRASRTGSHARPTVPVRGIVATSPCSSTPCMYNGTCLEVGDGFMCRCPTGHDPKNYCNFCRHGYFGKNCRQRCGGCDSLNDPGSMFLNEGLCHPITGCGTRCATGFNNPPSCDEIQCSTASLLVIFSSINDPCFPGRCLHDKCICPSNRDGPRCKDKRVLRPQDLCQQHMYEDIRDLVNCEGGGTCYMHKGISQCACPIGKVPIPVQDQPLRVICKRQCVSGSETCLHGECKGTSGQQCWCFNGYIGTHCEEPCTIERFGKYCGNLCGACKYLPCDGSTGHCPHKECLPGYVGSRCYIPLHNLVPRTIIRGSLKYDGPYLSVFNIPSSAERSTIRDAVVLLVDYGFFVTTGRNASYVQITAIYPGSVRVHYSAGFQSNFSSKRDFMALLTDAMRQRAAVLPDPLPGYRIIIKTIHVTDVLTRQSPAKKSPTSSKSDSRTITAVSVSFGLLSVAILTVLLTLFNAMKNFRGVHIQRRGLKSPRQTTR